MSSSPAASLGVLMFLRLSLRCATAMPPLRHSLLALPAVPPALSSKFPVLCLPYPAPSLSPVLSPARPMAATMMSPPSLLSLLLLLVSLLVSLLASLPLLSRPPPLPLSLPATPLSCVARRAGLVLPNTLPCPRALFDIIAKAGLQVGCAAGDPKCECSKNEEIQGLVFNDVVAAYGVLGGLDVIKAVTALCECDAAQPTFNACDGNSGPSASVPVPGGRDSTTTITTTDIVIPHCSTSTSNVVVVPSSTAVPGPEPSDATPPPPVVAGASMMMASTGCVALMAAVFAALLIYEIMIN
ncbi:hypothetical protein QBC32DRAFT_406127 [Pseudoneurospora amorphoporcata]|uniref:Extracellular membrane protein CFEM domain-containing protein n=1 Tax=Pseudoneurospora amorphoporcata TaxID=241081 RepID=A0AAN6NTX8_9PEZI|nr:hypothetical protein QBC32DRAFT_406127 [Pseudoneurospora amorphoporcata]